ncbi:Asp-tRNA(Asn)/Glu-tRNA(Gln) amidotransferase subunit GatA [Segetibacter sp. 3557_3]|uniref:Asp-tRNA(Asn)/Glu-tRNA(Gln) amidotransferase subunit GatA n=1 Tax=Segetibacter sp. 3557_3 TaxID=2547429 RepID=UPI0010589367|nr:Asp-tRNA(Asn)/Glu-tRNA(Gln) amidotransferase subunit GatA [Segetibacter sp. 3557_3]TDH19817.1 Asp-tRNA(Asn)/Glu-tRNA(Gln) amidotransferase subunit GatA [Segetibacter sp. 3557_3]
MFTFQSIESYHISLLNGLTTCVEAVQHYIGLCNEKKHLNAWLEVYEAEAMQSAEHLDRSRALGEPMGKLHGVVVGLKDVICFSGHRVSAASRILEDFTAVYSATATQRLLEAGAIILGRQNCDEFAMGSSNENSAYGVVRNAANENCVPGGSSGGSAVAVQAGMCMISLGSDTGGSVRQPADFCGIIGLKPTYGVISRYGLIAYASSFDQIGIFGLNVNDVFETLKVIGGPDDFDSTASTRVLAADEQPVLPQTARIAYFKEALDHPSLDPEIANSIKSYIGDLINKGYSIEPIDFEYLDYIVPTYYVLTTAEASSNLSRYDGVKFGHRSVSKDLSLADFYKNSRSEGFGHEVKRRIMLGTFVLSSGFYDAYFTKAQQVRQVLVNKTEEIFKDYDFVFLPTVPTPAFEIGSKGTTDPVEMFLADIYTVFANLVGIPAISLPFFKHSSGMPFGLQVLTSRFNELALRSLSRQLMEMQAGDRT